MPYKWRTERQQIPEPATDPPASQRAQHKPEHTDWETTCLTFTRTKRPDWHAWVYGGARNPKN